MDRRAFLASLAAVAGSRLMMGEAAAPLKFAHRQANMVSVPGESVFELARRIPGLSGVELQMVWKETDLSDRETGLSYKRAANKWAVKVPSLAGIWKKGESMLDPKAGEQALTKSIRTAELLGASTILIAMYKENCPDMREEKSCAPVVKLLQRMAPAAADAGVVLGCETSLAPADEVKLLELVGHASVKSYYDIANEEMYHPGEGVSGIRRMGARIQQCHLKNDERLLGEQPSRVDWDAAFAAYRAIGYRGWFVFETKHSSAEQCVEATTKNIQYVTARMGGV